MKKRNLIILLLISVVCLCFGIYISLHKSFEGTVHLFNNESSNVAFTSSLYLKASTTFNNKTYEETIPFNLKDSVFSLNLAVADKGTVEIKSKQFVGNAIQTIRDGFTDGTNIIEVKAVLNNALESIFIKEGESKSVGRLDLAFNNKNNKNAIHISLNNGKLFISSSYDLIKTTLDDKNPEAILMDSLKEFNENYIYKTNGVMFAFIKMYTGAKIKWFSGFNGMVGKDIMLADVSYKGKTNEIPIFVNNENTSSTIQQDEINLQVMYGKKEQVLPFYIKLEEFKLNLIGQSITAQSVESKVVVIDSLNNKNEKFSIKHNQDLVYNGYIIKQGLYDEDQAGTTLLVESKPNYWFMYIGLLLIFLSIALFFFSKEK